MEKYRIITESRVIHVVLVLLVIMSMLVLNSVAPFLFPTYYAYILIAAILFYIVRHIDFDIILAFSPLFYGLSIILLLATAILGEVSRGTVRWLDLGFIRFQPSEIVRPFVFLFVAYYISKSQLTAKRAIFGISLSLLPVLLIAAQPSLGVAMLTAIGFVSIFLARGVRLKHFLIALFIGITILPIGWVFMQPYQKNRIVSFLNPEADPMGAGYNSIQSMISVGSGNLFGRGLGEGVQTQLAFLPEKHTDFIFASITEELGLFGALLVVIFLFILFYMLSRIVVNPPNNTAQSYTAGVLLMLFSETFIHIGMNMGITPVTGVPLPFVSAGGSALIGTVLALAIIISAIKSPAR